MHNLKAGDAAFPLKRCNMHSMSNLRKSWECSLCRKSWYSGWDCLRTHCRYSFYVGNHGTGAVMVWGHTVGVWTYKPVFLVSVSLRLSLCKFPFPPCLFWRKQGLLGYLQIQCGGHCSQLWKEVRYFVKDFCAKKYSSILELSCREAPPPPISV